MTASIAREVLLLPACLLLAFAILRDIALRTIPNSLCAAVAVLGLAGRAVTGEWPMSLLAAGLVLLFAAFCWTRGWLGGGDVKLLAASALLVPPGSVPHLLAAVAFAGGGLAASYLIMAPVVPRPCGRPPARLLPRILRAERWRISGRRSLPYACAIATGAFITLLNG